MDFSGLKQLNVQALTCPTRELHDLCYPVHFGRKADVRVGDFDPHPLFYVSPGCSHRSLRQGKSFSIHNIRIPPSCPLTSTYMLETADRSSHYIVAADVLPPVKTLCSDNWPEQESKNKTASLLTVCIPSKHWFLTTYRLSTWLGSVDLLGTEHKLPAWPLKAVSARL